MIHKKFVEGKELKNRREIEAMSVFYNLQLLQFSIIIFKFSFLILSSFVLHSFDRRVFFEDSIGI